MPTEKTDADKTPSREEETWRIKGLADRLREKCLPEPNPWRPGFERRTDRSTVEVFQKLAALQLRYYAAFEQQKNDELEQREFYLNDMKRMGRHALLLLVPLFAGGQKRLCQHTGTPCPKLTDDRDQYGVKISRCDLRTGRYRNAWAIITQHALREGPAHTNGYSWPIISVRERSRQEIWTSSRGRQTKEKRETKQHVIGMAVVKEYRRHNSRGNSIEAAFDAVSKFGIIDGYSTGGRHNVEMHYKGFRKQCFERGFADVRAYWATYNGEPWPADQIWLADFPQNTDQ